MNRVLVIGERPEDAKALAFRLGLAGYESSPSASEAGLALRAAFSFKPDAIVLDVESGEDSRELFKLLTNVSQIPTIVLGDSDTGDDLVWYLEEGAAAYLTRPVSPALLAARLATVFRRSGQASPNGVIHAGSISIDVARRQVQKNGITVSLTPTEFRLLQLLSEHAGRPCSQQMLLEQVWGKDFVHCTHYLRLYMGYLRHKIEDDPRAPRLLVTEWGIGYRLTVDQNDAYAPAVQPRTALA